MPRRMKRYLLSLLCALSLCVPGVDGHACAGEAREEARSWLAERLRLSGWLETAQGVRLYSTDEPITSRLQARLEAAMDWEPFFAFVSLDAEKNWIVTDTTRLALREAWLEYAAESWSLRMGRQIIVWGKADGLRITDNICPVDYRDFMNRQRDDLRLPVTAALLRVSGDTFSTEAIWIPEFRHSLYPEAEDPWGALFAVGKSPLIREKKRKTPDLSLENSEIGLRTSGYFPAFDVSLSALYTWDDNPAYGSEVEWTASGPRIAVTPEHKRVTILGADVSVPWSDFVFRAEGALFLGRHISSTEPGNAPRRKDAIKWLVGADWSPGNDWTLTAQFSDEQILRHEANLSQKEHRHIATLNVSKKFLNQTLTLSGMAYAFTDDKAIASRFQAEYSVMDGMTLTAGLDIIDGGNGSYEPFKKNSQLWMKLKYSF